MGENGEKTFKCLAGLLKKSDKTTHPLHETLRAPVLQEMQVALVQCIAKLLSTGPKNAPKT